MDPVFLQIGNFTIAWYGVLITLGIVLGAGLLGLGVLVGFASSAGVLLGFLGGIVGGLLAGLIAYGLGTLKLPRWLGSMR